MINHLAATDTLQLPISRSANRRTTNWQEEITCHNLLPALSRACHSSYAHGLKTGIIPRSAYIPAISTLRLATSKRCLGISVYYRHVILERRRRSRYLEPYIAVAPRRVARQGKDACLAVISEAFRGVGEGHAVRHSVVCGQHHDVCARAAELEAVPVAGKGGESPSIDPRISAELSVSSKVMW